MTTTEQNINAEPIDQTNLTEPKPEETLISTVALHKSFSKKHVVKSVSLIIKSGEIIGLLDPISF